MANELFKLQIITPDKMFYEGDIKMVVFTTTDGDIGVLKNHIPLTTTVASGLAKITVNNEEKQAIVHGGFAEITGDKVTILADSAEWPHEVDVNRAQRAKERAQELLRNDSQDVDKARAEVALMRAIARLKHTSNE